MKRTKIILVVALCFLLSCSGKHFHGSPIGMVKIVIGSGFNKQMQDAVVLDSPDSIESFLKVYSYGSEREYTVKHRLAGYYEFHSSRGNVARMRFEGRIMRYKKKEYRLSKKTARMLSEYLKK